MSKNKASTLVFIIACFFSMFTFMLWMFFGYLFILCMVLAASLIPLIYASNSNRILVMHMLLGFIVISSGYYWHWSNLGDFTIKVYTHVLMIQWGLSFGVLFGGSMSFSSMIKTNDNDFAIIPRFALFVIILIYLNSMLWLCPMDFLVDVTKLSMDGDRYILRMLVVTLSSIALSWIVAKIIFRDIEKKCTQRNKCVTSLYILIAYVSLCCVKWIAM